MPGASRSVRAVRCVTAALHRRTVNATVKLGNVLVCPVRLGLDAIAANTASGTMVLRVVEVSQLSLFLLIS